MQQPVARVDVVRETHYGVTVEDPYRWMEDWKGEELKAWVQAQGAYTRSYLDTLPTRAAFAQRIHELGDAAPAYYFLSMKGGKYFYLRRDPGENIGKLVVRDNKDASERVLLNTNTLKDEVHTTIDWYFPSPDGNYVVYGISQGGSEESTLHVLEVESGKTLDIAISRTRFGLVNWLENSRSFLYHRFPEQPEGASIMEKYDNSRMYLHRLGDDPELDPVVFGRGISQGVEIDPKDFPFISTVAESEWMIGTIIHGVLNEKTLYVAPRSQLEDPVNITWRKVVDIEDAVIDFDLSGDTIYLVTHKDAPRFKVIATSLTNPDPLHATTIVPASTSVIQEIRVMDNYLLTRDLDGGLARLRRVRLSNNELEQVALPFDGTISQWAGEHGSSELLIQMTGWTVSPRIYLYDVTQNTLQDTGWSPPSPIDFSNVESHEVFATASDGTQIPLSIIHKKGLTLDRNNPTLLRGYGSYGLSMLPAFLSISLAWFEQGGVLAVGHIRGGGEYGEEWHQAGQKLNKQNTIDDFITCAEYLIQNGYTNNGRIGGEGTSAGGVPSGGSLTKRPDLWGAMIIRVAVTNFLRFEFTENGPPNIPEFGSITTEEGFKGLSIMDSYTKVRDGVNYPAVMLTTGLNDPRVVLWQATKMAARLQAATASDKPVILRVEEQAGHGMGSTKSQVEDELADEFAFLMQSLS